MPTPWWEISRTTTFHKFFELPQELRDKIYVFAFGNESPTFKVIWRAQWNERENRRRSSALIKAKYGSSTTALMTYELKRFPRNPLAQMIVSAQFYREAVQAWTEDTLFEFEQSMDVWKFIAQCKLDFLSNIRKIRTGHSARYNWQFCDNLSRCVNLHTLVVVVHNGMDLFDGKSEYNEELEESDFRNLELVKDIIRTGSMQSVEILPGQHDLADSPREIEQFKRNLGRLTAYIMKRLHARRSQQAQAVMAGAMGMSSISRPADVANSASSLTRNQPAVYPNFKMLSSHGCRPAAIQMRPESIARRNGNTSTIMGNFQNPVPHTPLGTQFRNDRALESQSFAHEALPSRTLFPRRFHSIKVSTKEAFVGCLLLVNTIGTGVAFYLAATL